MGTTFLAEATDFVGRPADFTYPQIPSEPDLCAYVDRAAYEELRAKLASAEHETAQVRVELLKLKVERDTAIAERNMVLQSLVKMVEARLVNSRAEAAKADLGSPGGQILNAIEATQRARRTSSGT